MPTGAHETAILARPGDRRVVDDPFRYDHARQWRTLRRPERPDRRGDARPILSARRNVLGHARGRMTRQHEAATRRVAVNAGGHRTDHAESMRPRGHPWQKFTELNTRHARRGRVEVAPDLHGRMRFGVERLVLGGASRKKQHNARTGLGGDRRHRCGRLRTAEVTK